MKSSARRLKVIPSRMLAPNIALGPRGLAGAININRCRLFVSLNRPAAPRPWEHHSLPTSKKDEGNEGKFGGAIVPPEAEDPTKQEPRDKDGGDIGSHPGAQLPGRQFTPRQATRFRLPP